MDGEGDAHITLGRVGLQQAFVQHGGEHVACGAFRQAGEAAHLLGEQGRWGHNDLQPQVAEVPVLIIARDAPPDALQALSAQQWISHYELGVWLAERMGSRVENPNLQNGEHFVQGKQLFGDNMIQRVRETPEGLVFDEPRLLSRWLRDLGEAPFTP